MTMCMYFLTAYIAVTNIFNNQPYCHASAMARFAIEAVKVTRCLVQDFCYCKIESSELD